MNLFPLDAPPLTPDAAEARKWAQEELAKTVYSQESGLLQRFFSWLEEQLAQVFSTSGNANSSLFGSLLMLSLFVLAVILIALYFKGRFRSSINSKSTVLGHGDQASVDLFALANQSFNASDFNQGVLYLYRAIIKALAERNLLQEHPGLTAAEAGSLGGRCFPNQAQLFTQAAQLFDDTAYGRLQCTAADYQQLLAFSQTLRTAKPVGLTLV